MGRWIDLSKDYIRRAGRSERQRYVQTSVVGETCTGRSRFRQMGRSLRSTVWRMGRRGEYPWNHNRLLKSLLWNCFQKMAGAVQEVVGKMSVAAQ